MPVITGYKVYVNSSYVETIPADSTSYVFSRLSPDTEYVLGVQAINDDGGSDITEVVETTQPAAMYAGPRHWTELRPIGDQDTRTRDIAMSDDGVYILAATNQLVEPDPNYTTGLMCFSSDSGQTWETLFDPPGNPDWVPFWSSGDPPIYFDHQSSFWTCCAISPNGRHMLICSVSGVWFVDPLKFSRVYKSDDYGATWVELTAAPIRYWYGCAISDDGLYLRLAPIDGTQASSTDGGINFGTGSATYYWYDTAMSKTGELQLITPDTSIGNNPGWAAALRFTNYGGTYEVIYPTPSTYAYSWRRGDICPSGDAWMLGAIYTGVGEWEIWLSKDYGVTWERCYPRGDTVRTSWFIAVCSTAGKRLLAGNWQLRLWESDDFNLSWHEERPHGDFNRNWYAGKMSNNGLIALAAENSGRIWRGILGPLPPTIHSFPWVGKFQLCHVT